MDKIQYEKISKPFLNKKSEIQLMNKLLTTIGYISYPILLVLSYYQNNLMKVLLVPASGFVLLTFVRKAINRKRPYETLNITPIIQKNKKGNSMPSRHVFSMSIIALSWFLVSPIIGAILVVCSILLACIRVIGGVHYPSDVLIAMLSACIWSCLYLF